MTADGAAALLDLGAQPGEQAHPAEHGADQGDALLALGVQPGELGLEPGRVAAGGAVDQPGEVALVAVGAERVDHVMVDRPCGASGAAPA